MANLENELHSLHGSKYYTNFDRSHAYWQLPLEPESQECQSLFTSGGFFSPIRVLHCSSNAVSHLQSALAAIFDPSIAKMFLAWLDDILLYESRIGGLLKVIE